jgi:hypothetical protein
MTAEKIGKNHRNMIGVVSSVERLAVNLQSRKAMLDNTPAPGAPPSL